MKLIIAVVEPDALDAVQKAIQAPEVYVLYVSRIGDLRDPHTSSYRGSEYREPRARLRMEIVVVNEMLLDETIDAISCAASKCGSGQAPAGNIFVTPLDEWVRIPAAVSAPAKDRHDIRWVTREAF